MKQVLLSLLLASSALTGLAQAGYPRPATTPHTQATPRPAAAPKVYVCGGGSAYAYHSSDNCAGLNRCTHGVSAVSVREAEGMNRRPCKKCY